MLKIAVCQSDDEVLDRVIRACFEAASVPATLSLHGHDHVDLCVCSMLGTPTEADAKILVLPECRTTSPLTASEVVTYGLCCKNTLTVASCIDASLVLSLQRSIVTLSGTRIDEQDIAISISDPDEPELVLAAVATLLLADVPIETITALPF